MLFLTMMSTTYGQQQDMMWMFGGSSINASDLNGYAWGNTVIDFKESPPKVYYDEDITLDFGDNNASICDDDGNILLYSNDMSVHNHQHQPIPGVDTISYSSFWELWSLEDYPTPGEIWLAGFTIVQNTIILPNPGTNDTYSLIYQTREVIGNTSEVTSLSYSTIRKIDDEGNYEVLHKDSPIINDQLKSGQVNACRHANGRDWWIIQQNFENTFQYVFLFDPSGITLVHTLPKTVANPIGSSTSQCYFSPDGTKYTISDAFGDLNTTSLYVYEFDRCSGISKYMVGDTIVNYGFNATLAYSPSSQYLYKSNHDEMFQYDLWSEDITSSRTLIGEYDGHELVYVEGTVGTPTRFGLMALAPNGKVYSAAGGSNRYLHSIEYPDEKGEDAAFVQRKIMLNTSNHVGVPNFPEYRLGPMDGSTCDTLGIDNDPVAKYRYEQDSTDYLDIRFTDLSYYRPEIWEWDFGDGTTFTGKYPYYHTYAADGIYDVCLTVSNENSSHQTCETLYLGVTNTTDTFDDSDISLTPNPVDEIALLQIHNYLPKEARFDVFTLEGKLLMSRKVGHGWNEMQLGKL